MAKKTYCYDPSFAYMPNIRRIDLRSKDDIVRDIGTHMLNRTQQIFKYHNLPDTIPQYMLESYLQRIGRCVITPVDGKLYALFGGFAGEPDAYYRPSKFVVANPYLGFNKELEIDKECVLCRNDHNMYGLLPIINRYSTMLAENELSMYIADIMTRLMSLITAGSDNDKEAARLFLNDIEAGKLGAVMSQNFMQSIETQPYASSAGSSLLGQLIEYEQYLKASMYNELGLDANYNMKRESLSMTESQMNDDALFPLIDDMLECRREFCDKVNELFGEYLSEPISVELSSSWETNDIEREEGEETDEEEKDDDVKEEEENETN